MLTSCAPWQPQPRQDHHVGSGPQLDTQVARRGVRHRVSSRTLGLREDGTGRVRDGAVPRGVPRQSRQTHVAASPRQAARRPVQPRALFRVLVCAARTLNAIGQTRVTLHLPQCVQQTRVTLHLPQRLCCAHSERHIGQTRVTLSLRSELLNHSLKRGLFLTGTEQASFLLPDRKGLKSA